MKTIHVVKTWCENTIEGISYLQFNGYGNVRRIPCTDYYICTEIGCSLEDVKVVL